MNNDTADREWVENFSMLFQKQQTKMQNPTAVECQVGIFLYYIRDERRYRKTANAFGVFRSSISNLIRKVAKIIVEHLRPELIKLPKNCN